MRYCRHGIVRDAAQITQGRFVFDGGTEPYFASGLYSVRVGA